MTPKKRAMVLWDMLPTRGLFYKCYTDDDGKLTKRILPSSDRKAVMKALHNYHDKNPTRRNFDDDIASFITSGAKFIMHCCHTGRKVPEDADFWTDAKKNTFLADVKDITAYRFAAKLLEARKYGLEEYAGQPQSATDDCATATALDGFTAAVDMATALAPMEAFGLNAFMNGDVAEDVVPSEDDAEYGDNDSDHEGEPEPEPEPVAAPQSQSQSQAQSDTNDVQSTFYNPVEPFSPANANAIAEAVQRLSMSGDWWEHQLLDEMEYEYKGPQENLDLPEDVDILSDSETDAWCPL